MKSATNKNANEVFVILNVCSSLQGYSRSRQETRKRH